MLAAVVAIATAVCAGCSSSSSDSSNDSSGSGTASGACSFSLFFPMCDLWSKVTPGTLAADQLDCEKVNAGTAQTSCPTSGVLGTCTVPQADPSSDSTDQIFYYPPDGGDNILTPAQDCANRNGTYSASP